MDKQKVLDKAVLGLFGPQSYASAFITTIYCSLKFRWNDEIPTACTNGLLLEINFDWFFSLSEKMRVTLLAHELWHIAYMHMMRIGKRDRKIFNAACDFAINGMLRAHGYHFDILPDGSMLGLYDPRFDGMSAEQIYDILIQEAQTIDLPFGLDFSPDQGTGEDEPELTVEQKHEVFSAVVRANIMSQMNEAEAGTLPGDFSKMLDQLLRPKIKWGTRLNKWMTELSDSGYTWQRPNRRYQDVYLPSKQGQEGLAQILWAIDCSMSLTDKQLQVIISEMRGVQVQFSPKSMLVASFDTQIQKTWEFNDGEEITKLEMNRNGGTCMREVFALAAKLKPQAMVMLSDMFCYHPPKPRGVDVLWICFDNPGFVPPYGKVIHVDTREDL